MMDSDILTLLESLGFDYHIESGRASECAAL